MECSEMLTIGGYKEFGYYCQSKRSCYYVVQFLKEETKYLNIHNSKDFNSGSKSVAKH